MIRRAADPESGLGLDLSEHLISRLRIRLESDEELEIDEVGEPDEE